MKKFTSILLMCCMMISLTACSSTKSLSDYDVDGIVGIRFTDIDLVCEDEKLVLAGTKILNHMQESDNLLLSFVVDSSIEITDAELGVYDHLVITNPEWISKFGDSSKLQAIDFKNLSIEMQEFLTLQMPLWTMNDSVLPDGVGLYEYNGDPLLSLPVNVGYVDAIEAENPLLVIVDNPTSTMKAKNFLLPMASTFNLVFPDSQQLQLGLDKSTISPSISSTDNIKLQKD